MWVLNVIDEMRTSWAEAAIERRCCAGMRLTLGFLITSLETRVFMAVIGGSTSRLMKELGETRSIRCILATSEKGRRTHMSIRESISGSS